MISFSQSFFHNTRETNVKRMSWLLAFLSFLIPLETAAQIQDIHALGIVTQALEKAKRDNKIRQDTIVAIKTHRIENLDANGHFRSFEKQMVFKTHSRDKINGMGKEYVEELIDIDPDGADPAENPLNNFDNLIDAFLSRFYFSLNSSATTINGRRCYQINFWPKEILPPERERIDPILNRSMGVMYIEEKTYALKTISGRLKENVDKSPFYYAKIFDFHIEFDYWKELDLIKSMKATTKYQYRDPRKVSMWFTFFRAVKRFQTHTFSYEYRIE